MIVTQHAAHSRGRPPDEGQKERLRSHQLPATGSGTQKAQVQNQAVDNATPPPGGSPTGYPDTLADLLGLTRQRLIAAFIDHGWKPLRHSSNFLTLVQS